jgi:hypothetical protein
MTESIQKVYASQAISNPYSASSINLVGNAIYSTCNAALKVCHSITVERQQRSR